MISLNIHLAKYRKLNGSPQIDHTEFIEGKRARTNVKSAGNQLLKWCIRRVLNPVKKDPHEITEHNLSGLIGVKSTSL